MFPLLELPLPEPPEQTASEETLQVGAALFTRHCEGCHGAEAVGWGRARDLRYLTADFISDAQLEAGDYDAVIFQAALHHFPDQPAVAARVKESFRIPEPQKITLGIKRIPMARRRSNWGKYLVNIR